MYIITVVRKTTLIWYLIFVLLFAAAFFLLPSSAAILTPASSEEVQKWGDTLRIFFWSPKQLHIKSGYGYVKILLSYG